MAGYNACAFIGNIGKLETRHVGAEGIPVTSLSIAVTEREKVDGKWTDVTTWLNCTLWRHEHLLNYLEVGKQVHISAKYKVREYEKDGEKRKSHEFEIQNIVLLGGKGDKQERSEPAQVRSMPRSVKPISENLGVDDSDLPF